MATDLKASLFAAIADGDVSAVRKLISDTPSLLEQIDDSGFTPLMRAVSSSERTLELVEALVAAGADVNAKTAEGYTALHLMIDVSGATGTGELPGQIARLLVAAGADIEARQHWGWTPLMQAVVEGTPDELQALVTVGADVNRLFPANTFPEFLRRRTTLMAAIADPDKVRILLSAGVALTATDGTGQTALQYANDCLADAPGSELLALQISQELTNASMLEALQHLKEAGIDPDAPIDATGKTMRQFLEGTFTQTFADATAVDYRGRLQESIAIIQKALGAP